MKLPFTSKVFILPVLLMAVTTISLGQAVGINESGASPNAKSILDIASTTKGLLVPRMTTMERNAIGAGPAQEGMMVYDTDLDRYMFFNGATWARLGDGLWMEAAPGIQNAITNVGIGTAPTAGLPLSVSGGAALAAAISNSGADFAFGLRVINSIGTGVAAFSGTSTGGFPTTPAAVYGRGSDGAFGAFFTAEDAAGTGVLAQSQGTGPALDAWAFGTGLAAVFRGGYVNVQTRLGIGTSTPLFPIDVQTSTLARAGYFYNNFVSASTTFGIYAGAFGTGTGEKRGGSFDAFGAGSLNVGLKSFAGSATTNIGLLVNATGGTTNWAAHFDQGHVIVDDRVGIGTAATPTNKLQVQGEETLATPVVSSTVNYIGSSDVRAYHGTSIPAPGWGYGGEFIGGYRGVYGSASATTYTGEATGVYGIATGSAGTRTGVFGTASGGTTNWAGYFGSGNVFVLNDLRVGDSGGAVGYKLSVDGKIICEELKVQSSVSWPDYVFANDYRLMPITELDQHIKEHRHLPGIPSAAQVNEDGIMIGDMQKRMMEKIEELTLYIIAQDKRITELEGMLSSQKQ